jgi:autotransporter-associated beta strand protein
MAAAMLFLAGRAGQAASITFTPPANCTGDTDALTTGGNVYAYDWGTSTTLNGIPFTSSTSIGNVGSGNITLTGFRNAGPALFAGTSAPYTNLSAAYQNVLKGGVYSNTVTAGYTATVALNNLQVSHMYSVQVWVNDSRGIGNTNRTEWIYDGVSLTTNLLSFNTIHTNGGVGQHIWGNFTADGSSQSFVLDNDSPGNSLNNNILQMNAVQLRDVTGVWGGTTSGTWADSDGTSANFTGMNYQAVKNTGATNVYFGDVDGLNNPVTRTSVTIGTGGVSGENVVFQNNLNSYTFNSADATGIAGGGNVTLAGTNTVTFSGANTYSGNTILGANSILRVGNSGALADSSLITLNAGSLLDASPSSLPLSSSQTLNGSGAIKGNVTAASGATIVVGNIGSVGTLSFSNNLTLNGQTLNFDLGATSSSASDKIIIASTLTLNGNSTISLNLLNGTLFNGTYTLLAYGSKSGTGNFVLDHAYPGVTINNTSTSVTLTVTGGLAGGGTSSVWTNRTGGNWTTPSNWQGSIIATNQDGVADFSTLTLPANESINVNSTNITIGYMIFGDVGQTYNWTLTGGTNTLAVSSGSPTILTGTNMTATINSVLAGSQGFTVKGSGSYAGNAGIVVLGGANTITNGAYVVNGGQLAVTSVKALSYMSVSSNNPVILSNGLFEFATSGAQYFTNDLYLLGNANITNTIYQGSSAQDNFVGRIAGTGVLNIVTPGGVVFGQRGDMTGFTGTVLVTGNASGNNASGLLLANGDTIQGISGSSNTVFDFEGGTLNYLYSGTPTATNYLGALVGNNGNVILQVKNGAGNVSGNLTVEVGALNTDTSFAGKFRDYANANTGATPPQLGIRKVGTGTLTLSGANVNTGPSEIRRGQLTVSGSYAAPITVDSGAAFELSGSLGSAPITVNGGGTFLLDNGGNLGTAAVQVNGLMDVSAWSGYFNLQSASLNGSGVVTGAVTLASTTVNPGPIGAAGTLTITNGDLTVNGGTLAFDLSDDATNGVNDQLIVNGNLNLNNPATVSINKLYGFLNGGTYRLIKFSGALNGSLANLTLQGTGPLDTLQQNGNEIDLVVSPVATAIWTGGTAGNLWDVVTSPNWTFNGVKSLFTNGEAALFNDAGATNPVVTIPATVQPVAVTVFSSSNYTFTGTADIGDGASLTKSGTGTLTVLNANTYVGGTFVTGGTLKLGDGATQNGSVVGNIADSATLIVANPAAQMLSGVISGAGALVKQGTGVLTLNATNTLTGPTTISAGVIELGDGSSSDGLLGNGSVIDNSQLLLMEIATATISNNITGTGGIDNNSSAAVILAGNIAGACTLTNDASASTLYLSASNSYSGGTIINNGTVIVNDPILHGLGLGKVVINDGTGTLQFYSGGNGTNIVANNIQLPADTTQDQFSMPSQQTVRLTGLITGGAAGQITRFVNITSGGDNREVLILDNPNNTFTTVPETYFGTLAFTSDGALGNPTNCISVNVGSKINTAFYNPVNDGLTFAASNITLNVNRAVNLVGVENINVQSYNGTILGPITGNGLIKLGIGTLTLNGPGSLTNSTTVSAGTLVLNNVWTGTNVTVNSGATLSGAGSINTAIQISSGGTLAPGIGSTALLTVTSNLLFNAGSTAHMNVNAGTVTSDRVAGIGTVTYAGTLAVNNLGGTFAAGQSFQLFSAAGHSGNFASTNLPPLAGGLAWNWNPANGTLSVVSGVNTNPTNITATVSGGNLNLSWPADHTGWRLVAQTNALNHGLGTNWVTWPNSTTTNAVSVPINSANPATFFQLVYP